MTSSAAARPPRNIAGIIAFVLALVWTAGQIVLSGLVVAIPALASSGGVPVSSIGVVFAVIGAAQVVLAALTAVFGIIGVVRRDAPRVLAAVALGVGASGVITGVASLVVPPLAAALLSA